MSRPSAYAGDQPFLFVSYSHRDSDLVWPIIDRLMVDGYRVWYDDGIEPGSEWDENIASHIRSSGCFVSMMSDNYLASANCKDELNFARDEEKQILIIYLNDVIMPDGMRMRLSRLQAMFWEEYRNKNKFFEALYRSRTILPYREGYVAPPAPAVSPSESDQPLKTAIRPGKPGKKRTAHRRSAVKKTAPSKQSSRKQTQNTCKRKKFDWRQILPPGFRHFKPVRMLIATAVYAGIFLFSIASQQLWYLANYSGYLFVLLIATALWLGNYLNCRTPWFVRKASTPLLRIVLESLVFLVEAAVLLVVATIIFY